MPIISVETVKTIDEREMQKTTKKTNKQRQKGARGTEAIVKGWELSDFVMHSSCFSFVVFCISLSSTVFIISS